ncbi:hypothetical protein ABZ260_08290 [Streptosporangium sp. NPDC006013]|uniref:hypothetical protein n=1 Tax=Streptosporangium sp. NPDC006013 TaxID=3155596 RepID=UPI0033BF585C
MKPLAALSFPTTFAVVDRAYTDQDAACGRSREIGVLDPHRRFGGVHGGEQRGGGVGGLVAALGESTRWSSASCGRPANSATPNSTILHLGLLRRATVVRPIGDGNRPPLIDHDDRPIDRPIRRGPRRPILGA